MDVVAVADAARAEARVGVVTAAASDLTPMVLPTLVFSLADDEMRSRRNKH